jgi:hypothetical protein
LMKEEDALSKAVEKNALKLQKAAEKARKEAEKAEKLIEKARKEAAKAEKLAEKQAKKVEKPKEEIIVPKYDDEPFVLFQNVALINEINSICDVKKFKNYKKLSAGVKLARQILDI